MCIIPYSSQWCTDMDSQTHIHIRTRTHTKLSGLNAHSSFAWSSTAQSVCEWAFRLVSQNCKVPILHSTEEDNLVLFVSKWHFSVSEHYQNQTTNMYIASQGWTNSGSEVKWAECSLIIGTGCWAQVFAWSSIAQSVQVWVDIQTAGDLVSQTCNVRILHSAKEITSLCQSTIKNRKHTHTSFGNFDELLINKKIFFNSACFSVIRWSGGHAASPLNLVTHFCWIANVEHEM